MLGLSFARHTTFIQVGRVLPFKVFGFRIVIVPSRRLNVQSFVQSFDKL